MIDIPFAQLLYDPSLVTPHLTQAKRAYFICRKGNDSFLAARAFRRYLASATVETGEEDVEVIDVRGGLQAWSRLVDVGFPIY